MIGENEIKEQMSNALEETNMEALGERYKGKVRDNYSKGNRMVMVTTDRISAFDVVLGTLPFKGQILNQMAVYWFDNTKDIVGNHIIDNPDPNVMVVKKCKGLPVEMVIRGYITGSLWRDYESGKRDIYGLKFEDDLKFNQKFPQPIITPTTKAEYGQHDEEITRQQIIDQGLVDEELYEKMEETALLLFKRGTEMAAKNGLILVDTKYEFGLDENGELTLMDEIHTPDSSRYWFENEYSERFASGQEQKMLDKEHVRNWLKAQGFMGDGEPPELSEQIKIEAVQKYLEAFEKITGQEFQADVGDVKGRIERNLGEKGYM